MTKDEGVERFGDVFKNVSLTSSNTDMDAFEEQLKAANQGKEYKHNPGLRDEEIWRAGIETRAEIEERKRLQKEASKKLKEERLATKNLLDSIHSMKKTAKKGGQSRRTRRATQKKRIHKKH
jgi:hypothetical protein